LDCFLNSMPATAACPYYCITLNTRDQMPEELLYHPEVMELLQAIKDLQADFVDTHKALDAAQQEVKCVASSQAARGWRKRLRNQHTSTLAGMNVLQETTAYAAYMLVVCCVLFLHNAPSEQLL
jgi:hypothetical protein